MLKICHLRGPKEYWLQKLIKNYYLITKWQEIRQFNFLEYRKRIRDIVISSIKNSNEYDVICYNDEELKLLLSKLNVYESILYHSQDDDDIYVGKNLTNKLSDGVYHTPYVVFDKFLVKKLHDKREYIIDLEQLYKRSSNKTGSCNLIIQSKYIHIKPLLNSIVNNSFYTRNRIRGFFKASPLKQTNIHYYFLKCLTYLDRNTAT